MPIESPTKPPLGLGAGVWTFVIAVLLLIVAAVVLYMM